MSLSDMLYLKNGGRREFWLTHLNAVAAFIKENRLTPIEARLLGAAGSGAHGGAAELRAATAAVESLLLWDPRPGGWPLPHLHYAGEIYALTESQWAEFSKKAMGGFVEKLRATQKVTFNQLMDVSAAVAEL